MRFIKEYQFTHKGLSTPIIIYIVAIIVAGKKIHKCEMKNHSRITELPSEESHPVTDPLGENSRNPAKKQETSLSLPNHNVIIINIICIVLYKRWK